MRGVRLRHAPDNYPGWGTRLESRPLGRRSLNPLELLRTFWIGPFLHILFKPLTKTWADSKTSFGSTPTPST